MEYLSGQLSNGLLDTPGFNSSRDFLTWFYQFPGEFVNGLAQVFGITENGISILVTILLVCLILYTFMTFTTTHH